MKLDVAVFGLVTLILVGMSPGGTEPTARHMVTGTLTQLDLTAMKGQLDTDLGNPVFFVITKPQLFQHLSVGSLVTIEIDHSGGAGKVMAASMAEFVAPTERDDRTVIEPA